jgi:soluble lytic murein transglycosylase-like protein
VRWALILTVLVFPSLSSGSPLDPFTYAASVTGIPIQLLVAISHVESSHHPWALNIDGAPVYPRSRTEAERILQSVPENVDIGLMQINFRIWGRTLGLTKTELLDPYINVWTGAIILRYYLSRYDFWEAVGRYHSGSGNRQIIYSWKVYETILRMGQQSSYIEPLIPYIVSKKSIPQ